VGEIPNLMTQGTLWRNQMLYDLMSEYEILRLQLCRLGNFLMCCRGRRISHMCSKPLASWTNDEKDQGHLTKAWNYTEKYFWHEQIQDSIPPKIEAKQASEQKE